MNRVDNDDAGAYFNCTIQELKLLRLRRRWCGRLSFQLHHTGIKTIVIKSVVDHILIFQLHHTGIKTEICWRWKRPPGVFQLHHTGIKTLSVVT